MNREEDASNGDDISRAAETSSLSPIFIEQIAGESEKEKGKATGNELSWSVEYGPQELGQAVPALASPDTS